VWKSGNRARATRSFAWPAPPAWNCDRDHGADRWTAELRQARASLFPNLPDQFWHAVAGKEQANVISFNHKKGIWEPVGSMTVSADGSSSDRSGCRHLHRVGMGRSAATRPPPSGPTCRRRRGVEPRCLTISVQLVQNKCKRAHFIWSYVPSPNVIRMVLDAQANSILCSRHDLMCDRINETASGRINAKTGKL